MQDDWHLKASMACTSVGPSHQAASRGSLGGAVRFSFSVPTAGSHCRLASRKPHCFRKGSSCARISSNRACGC